MIDAMIAFGAAVKALGEGRVGGYVVQYGSEATRDGDGEWFTPETDFDTEFPARASVYYNHGQDAVVGKRRLAYGTLRQDELGLWVEAQLDMRDRYQAAMYQLAQAEKLGWSSGAINHYADPPRSAPGGPIKSWVGVAHDCSLTPIPCDRRTRVMALKNWEPRPLEELAGEIGCAVVRSVSLNEALEQWIDTGEVLAGDCRRHAVKAGRKISGARRERLQRAYDLIGEMLSETAPREAEEDEAEATLVPVTGSREEEAMPLPGRIAVPDLSNLCAALSRQDDRRSGAPSIQG